MDQQTAGGITNYVFRGNEPKINNGTNDVFAWDLLKNYLTASAAKENVKLPQDYYLYDLKLYYFDLTGDEKMEVEFFQNNPALGTCLPLRIFGDPISPNALPAFIRDPQAKDLPSWQHDDLPAQMALVESLLSTTLDKSGVVYIHCECGCDRTGEVAGSYALKYLGWNYTAVYNWDEAIAGRWISPFHNWALEWYCYYLVLVENLNVGPCKYEGNNSTAIL